MTCPGTYPAADADDATTAVARMAAAAAMQTTAKHSFPLPSVRTDSRRPGVCPLGGRQGKTGKSAYAGAGSDSGVRLDQHVGDLGPRELLRRPLAAAEHLAHGRAREEHLVLVARRRGLRRRHRLRQLAEERVLVLERLDAQLAGLELVEDVLRVVGAVVVADAGVVAADDEVRAAVVPAHERVEDRLARAGVAHRGRVHARAGRAPARSSSRSAPRSSASASRPGCRPTSSRRRSGG